MGDKYWAVYYYLSMRIGGELPPAYMLVPLQNPVPPSGVVLGQGQPINRPDVIVDISPAGWAASGRADSQGIAQALGALECETCNSRRYQDGSSDPSVSFQSPTHISPGQAASAVAAHEAEHVTNEQANAERDGREIISQTVRLKTSICPECKVVYVSGGETRTISRPKVDMEV